MAMDRPRINAAIHMRPPSGQGVIRRPSPAATRPVRPPATRCHRRSIYRSTTRPRMGEFTVPSTVSFFPSPLCFVLSSNEICNYQSWHLVQQLVLVAVPTRLPPCHQQLITHTVTGVCPARGTVVAQKVIGTLKHLNETLHGTTLNLLENWI